jgi:hypothetical protein
MPALRHHRELRKPLAGGIAEDEPPSGLLIWSGDTLVRFLD